MFSGENNIKYNNIKSNQRRNIQRKQKEMNSFINDKSLSDSDSESMYFSALTNPTTFTKNSTKSVPASIKRYYKIYLF